MMQQQQLPNQRVHSSHLSPTVPSRSSSSSSSSSKSASSLLQSSSAVIAPIPVPNNSNNSINKSMKLLIESIKQSATSRQYIQEFGGDQLKLPSTPTTRPTITTITPNTTPTTLLCSSNFTKIDHLRIPDKLSVHRNMTINNRHYSSDDQKKASSILQEAATTMMMMHQSSSSSSSFPQENDNQRTTTTTTTTTMTRFGGSKRSLLTSDNDVDIDDGGGYNSSSKRSLFNSDHDTNATDDTHRFVKSNTWPRSITSSSASAKSTTRSAVPESLRKSYSTSPSQPSSCLADPSSYNSSSPSPPRRKYFLLDEIREEVRTMREGTRLKPLNQNTIKIIVDGDTKIRTDKILGIGTFSTVTRVTIDNDQHQQQDEPTNENESRGEVVPDRRRRRFGLRRPIRYYACKSVKKSIVEMGENAVLVGSNNNGVNSNIEDNIMYRREYVNAIAQIANEIHVLSSFDHPNIIKIRGSYCNERSVVSASASGSASSASSLGSFLLTDVLQETLDQRIERWKRNSNTLGDSNSSNQSIGNNSNHSETSTVFSSSSSTSSQSHQHQLNTDKFDICLQLASALEYVHSRNVIYRDLKSSNVGFAADGRTLQLFDFGLCVELTPTRPVAEGIIGTLRYMAPEVCLNEQYGLEADIYSFGIVAWEIWTTNLPYEELTPDLYRDWVCIHGYRPPDHDRDYNRNIPEQQQQQQQPQSSSSGNSPTSLHDEVTHLLSQTWKHIPSTRISWTQIQNQFELFQQLEELRLEECELLC
jgi:serine/threonine protein kinase